MACRFICNPPRRLLNKQLISGIDTKSYTSHDKSEKNVQTTHSPQEVTKDSLQWRTTWLEKEGWYPKLKIFSSEKSNADIIKFLQTPIDLWPSSIMKWRRKKQEEIEKQLQQYLPERNAVLGDDLAAAHFVVFRGGAVKFLGEKNWIRKDKNGNYDLPGHYSPDKVVEAIDCSDMNLYYEGLDNLRNLNKIQWLSLRGCKNMDDWCMDRIAGSLTSLEYLDIRNCDNITERGIGALYKITKLETLLLDDRTKTKSLELTCLMLQELLPKLQIKNEN